MYTPSLSFLLCLAAPLVGLWMAKRKTSPLRIYLTLAAMLGVTGGYIILAEFALGAARLTSWLLTTTLLLGDETSNAKITMHVAPASPLASAGILAACALLIWLQKRRSALYFPRFTSWIAAPLTLFAFAAEPLLIALPYVSGMLAWEFAAPPVKAAGIIGIASFALFGLAVLGFLLQLIISLIKHLRQA